MMTNVSIYGKNWIDLVFEGKNKSYGAYQLRQQNQKTTIIAFFYAILLLVALSGMGMLFSSFGEKPIAEIPLIDDGPVIVTFFPKNPVKKTIVPIERKPGTETKITKKTILDPEIVKTDFDDVNTNAENKNVNNDDELGTSEGTADPDTAAGGISNTGTEAGIATPVIPDNTAVGTNVLDKLPEFPGGINKFYDFVGRNFNPDVEVAQKINVLMYFVIEKDGSMTDIKVLRNPGYGLDKEAIRVLKSLKTKWAPGIKDGKPMRTAYTLPIAIQPQQ